MAIEVSDELRKSIDEYNSDPVSYQERYAAVDVTNLRRFFASYLPVGGRVLDAGCGTGRDVAAFAEAGFEVDGVDLSSELLSIALDACPTATFGLGDIRDMPFEDGTFDGVWAMASLVHLDHAGVEEALAEIRRVMKPGGWLFVTLKADEFDSSRWEGDRWFSFWTPETAQSMFKSVGLGARDVRLDAESIGGAWINALLFHMSTATEPRS